MLTIADGEFDQAGVSWQLQASKALSADDIRHIIQQLAMIAKTIDLAGKGPSNAVANDKYVA